MIQSHVAHGTKTTTLGGSETQMHAAMGLTAVLIALQSTILGSPFAVAQFTSTQQASISLERNKAQAKEVARALQNQELTKISKQLSTQSRVIMGNNPDAAIPATVLSLGTVFWIGHKINIIKSDDFKLSSRLEGRGKCASINLDSALMSGKLNFAQNEGVKFAMNKNLDEINLDAELNYLIKDQLIHTELRHHLTRNLAVCVGLSQSSRIQSDQNARILYNVNF